MPKNQFLGLLQAITDTEIEKDSKSVEELCALAAKKQRPTLRLVRALSSSRYDPQKKGRLLLSLYEGTLPVMMSHRQWFVAVQKAAEARYTYLTVTTRKMAQGDRDTERSRCLDSPFDLPDGLAVDKILDPGADRVPSATTSSTAAQDSLPMTPRVRLRPRSATGAAATSTTPLPLPGRSNCRWRTKTLYRNRYTVKIPDHVAKQLSRSKKKIKELTATIQEKDAAIEEFESKLKIEKVRSSSLKHSLTDLRRSYDALSADLAKTEEELGQLDDLRLMPDEGLDALISQSQPDNTSGTSNTSSSPPHCPEDHLQRWNILNRMELADDWNWKLDRRYFYVLVVTVRSQVSVPKVV